MMIRQKHMYIFWLEGLMLLALVLSTSYVLYTGKIVINIAKNAKLIWSFFWFTVICIYISVSDILRAFAALLDALTFQYYSVDGGLKKSELHEHRAHFQRDRKTGRFVYRPHQIMYYFIKVHEKKPRRFVCMEYLPLDDGRYYTFIVGRFSSVIVDVLDKDGKSLWLQY